MTVEPGDIFGWTALDPAVPGHLDGHVDGAGARAGLRWGAAPGRAARGPRSWRRASTSRSSRPSRVGCWRRASSSWTSIAPRRWNRGERHDDQRLLAAARRTWIGSSRLLRDDGRTVIGPTVVDGAIVYDEIDERVRPAHGSDRRAVRRPLPAGQRIGAHVRLRVVAEQLEALHVPAGRPAGHRAPHGRDRSRSRRARRDVPKLAFLGVRACDLAALRIHDKVLSEGPFIDDDFVARRWSRAGHRGRVRHAIRDLLLHARWAPAPRSSSGHDLVLTELDDGFVVRAGSVARPRAPDAPRAWRRRRPSQRTRRGRRSASRRASGWARRSRSRA